MEKEMLDLLRHGVSCAVRPAAPHDRKSWGCCPSADGSIWWLWTATPPVRSAGGRRKRWSTGCSRRWTRP